jgi:hypothetical protein
MKTFKILHPVGGVLNHNMERGLYEFEAICAIDAESLEQAFKLSQNDFSDVYASLNKRSTSVGDIIIDTDDSVCYMVFGIGFVEIPQTVAQYIDWGNHLESLEDDSDDAARDEFYSKEESYGDFYERTNYALRGEDDPSLLD